VFIMGVQFAGGAIDIVLDPPTVHVAGVCWEDGMTSDQARELAIALLLAAEERDRWAALSG
jgi:hypothetical protein